MAAGHIVLIRHGRTAYNAEMRLQGQVDIDLDDVGRWQATAAAEVLSRGRRPGLILASDLSRAHETANIIASKFSEMDVEVDARVRERSFGPWEGMTGEEISVEWAEEFAQWRGGAEPNIDGIESKAVVGQRMVEAIFEAAVSLEDTQTLFVVSHGAAISCAIATLLDQDPTTWRGVAGMSNVHWSKLFTQHCCGRSASVAPRRT
ncbi:histidine phosphatase family protein [Timonella sp. A28]|uniref:histidine phosphatase family protein n=1 Tax=Timonella sp. A28 TaxID=3442640 RepID=UPI003EB9DC5E